jgi:hypothetical protein
MFGKTGELRHIGRSWDCLAPTPREISALRDDSLCCFFSAFCTLRTSFFRGPPPNDPVTTRSDFGRTHGSASTDIFFCVLRTVGCALLYFTIREKIK